MNEERRLPKKWAYGTAAAALLLVVPVLAFRSPGRASLTGKAFFQNKPVMTGTVIALGADGKLRSAAISADGKYVIDDLPTGTVKLGVVSRDPNKAEQRLQKMNDRLPGTERAIRQSAHGAKWFAIPPAFEDPRGSGLEFNLKSNAEFEIRMN